MRHMGMTHTSRRQGLHQQGSTSKDVTKVGDDLLAALKAMEKARASLRKYVQQNAGAHAKDAALDSVDQIIGDAARGMLVATQSVVQADGVGRKTRDEFAGVEAGYSALLVECGDVFKGQA